MKTMIMILIGFLGILATTDSAAMTTSTAGRYFARTTQAKLPSYSRQFSGLGGKVKNWLGKESAAWQVKLRARNEAKLEQLNNQYTEIRSLLFKYPFDEMSDKIDAINKQINESPFYQKSLWKRFFAEKPDSLRVLESQRDAMITEDNAMHKLLRKRDDIEIKIIRLEDILGIKRPSIEEQFTNI